MVPDPEKYQNVTATPRPDNVRRGSQSQNFFLVFLSTLLCV